MRSSASAFGTSWFFSSPFGKAPPIWRLPPKYCENDKDITVNVGRFGPYLKCENKSARLENVDELFDIGLNRAVTLIAEAKPGRISSSIIKDLGEHPEDKKPVRIMKGQYGPYIKYKS